MQAQIQALLVAQGAGVEREAMGFHLEVAKPAIFSGEAGKVGGFISACKIYIRNRMRENTGETGAVGIIIYTGRISRYVEGECDGGIRGRGSRV